MKNLKSHKTKILMLAIILLIQIILPMLTVMIENGITITSMASTGTWYIGAGQANKIKAVLDEDGILTISGTGTMEEWTSAKYVPWTSLKTNIKKVVIESGVSNIGNYAFYGCSNLIDITFNRKYNKYR